MFADSYLFKLAILVFRWNITFYFSTSIYWVPAGWGGRYWEERYKVYKATNWLWKFCIATKCFIVWINLSLYPLQNKLDSKNLIATQQRPVRFASAILRTDGRMMIGEGRQLKVISSVKESHNWNSYQSCQPPLAVSSQKEAVRQNSLNKSLLISTL